MKLRRTVGGLTVLRCPQDTCLAEFNRSETIAVLRDHTTYRWDDRPVGRQERAGWAGAKPGCPVCLAEFPEEYLLATKVLTVSLIAPSAATKTHYVRWVRASLEGRGPVGEPPDQVLASTGWSAAFVTDSAKQAEWDQVMKTTNPWISDTEHWLDKSTERHVWPFVLSPKDRSGSLETASSVLVQLVDFPGDRQESGQLLLEFSDVLAVLIPPEVLSDSDVEGKFKEVVGVQLDNALREHTQAQRGSGNVPAIVFVLTKSDRYGKAGLPSLPTAAYRPREEDRLERRLGSAIDADSKALFGWLETHFPMFASYLMRTVSRAVDGTVWFTAVGGLGPDIKGAAFAVGPTTRTLDPVLIALGRAGLVVSR